MYIIKKAHKPGWARSIKRWTRMKVSTNRHHRKAYKRRLRKYAVSQEEDDEPIPIRKNEMLTSWDVF